ncbi:MULTISPECIES: hypothetical protein [Halomonas]|uniref:Uncharacterized protein n=1 Tax=Halomonas citrativorans TaxID=2742612 RepID=A0A1R4I2Y5_9GAMM|nr:MULTISPECIES: hypothetical protein [Halomonas]MBE0403289.1 hypothetical protein [Halomonas citrativorans]SJN14155.1 hypothetical protein CZ787_13725 [Halomonas citrativorans]HCR99002.1 hypothetical protein [Halomonas sp.]
MMERYPDIEVYVASISLEALNAWLASALAAPPLSPAGKGKWKTHGQHQGKEVPILLVEKAADRFASLWFDSSHTPWMTDQECAQHAAEALQTEVRCSLGGWHPGDDPDRFWQVLPGGKEGAIEWPDSGR